MRRTLYSLAISVSLGLVTYAAGCSSSNGSGFGSDDGGSSDGSKSCGITGCVDFDAGDGQRGCVNLECQRQACSGPLTSVSGKVFDPKGEVPLYNVVVYIPNSPPKPISHGATCDTCGSTAVNPVGEAVLTNTKGEFIIPNAPVGDEIPLVIQVGKWRREMTIKVEACKDNKFVDPQKMRLPRNRTEGEMPSMALTTGGCDPFGCLFSRLGIDKSEFTAPSGKGAVHVYQGTGGGNVQGGGATKPETALWNNVEALKKYDIVLLSCECDEYNNTKPAAAKKAMRDYLNAGGRVFATHYHYTWFKNGESDLAGLANWTGGSGSPPYTIDETFPKGQALADWLLNIGATPTKGKIDLSGTANDVGTVKTGAQRWISVGSGATESVKYFTFNAPVGAKPEEQCGRGVMSDLHVSAGGGDDENLPSSCNSTTLTPQERALEFMFFDLSSCVQDDKVPPTPPK